MERKGCDSWKVLCFFARWWKPDFHHTSFVYICEYTKNPLEEGMETHSSILAWGMPWTEKPSELQSIGSQRAGHDWSDLEHRYTPRNATQQLVRPSLVIYSLSPVQFFATLWTVSSPGSSVHGISQARILECVAISFSRGSSPTQGPNPNLLHWQADSLSLSYLGRPRPSLDSCKMFSVDPAVVVS